jgi:two-component system nitrogen regulation sensor histidine kinase NtrY
VPDSLETTTRRSPAGVALDIALGRVSTLLLASLALLLGIATFAILAGRVKLTIHSGVAVGMTVADFAVLLLLILVLAGRVIRVIQEQKRGTAGARLHVRLVFLFGVVAAVPAILVAIFATVFFNFGIQAWFNQRVQTALAESSQVAQGYLVEHDNDIRLDALAMASDLSQIGSAYFGDPNEFERADPGRDHQSVERRDDRLRRAVRRSGGGIAAAAGCGECAVRADTGDHHPGRHG